MGHIGEIKNFPPHEGTAIIAAPEVTYAAALEAAHARRGVFSLVEVMLPRGVTSDTLARFVAGFKSAREKKG